MFIIIILYHQYWFINCEKNYHTNMLIGEAECETWELSVLALQLFFKSILK